MSDITGKIVVILTAIIGVAILSVLVSQHSQTASVIKQAGDSFAGIIKAAVGPVS